jgi:hypothetical protein
MDLYDLHWMAPRLHVFFIVTTATTIDFLLSVGRTMGAGKRRGLIGVARNFSVTSATHLVA